LAIQRLLLGEKSNFVNECRERLFAAKHEEQFTARVHFIRQVIDAIQRPQTRSCALNPKDQPIFLAREAASVASRS